MPEQQPIAGETEPRLAEGGRPVLLKHKMADPGASVSGDWGTDEQQWPSRRKRSRDHGDDQPAADVMQQPADRVAVLAEIVDVEPAERPDALGTHRADSAIRAVG